MTRRPVFLWGLVLILLIWSVGHVLWDQQIEIIQVETEGAHVPVDQVRHRLSVFRGHNFWTLDLNEVRQRAEGHPWVASVRVARVWPSTLIVRVQEHHVVARWGTNGLLSDRGVVFFPDLKTLKPFRDHVLIEGRRALAPVLLETVRWLKRKARSLQWSILSLRRHPHGTLEVRWKPHGRLTLMDEDSYREEFHRLVTAWPKLAKSLRIQAKIFDLRYSSGFAVRN